MNIHQKDLMDLLQQHYKSEESLTTWLCDTLDISRPTAYRYLSGETAISYDQFIVLTKLVPGLPNAITEKTAVVPTRMVEVSEHHTEADFQNMMEQRLLVIQKFQKLDNPMLHYTARDVILFQFINNFDLLNYKFRVWHPELKNHVISKITLDLGKELFEAYRLIPSREFLFNRAFIAQFIQIKFDMKMGSVDLETGKRLYNILRQKLVETIEWSKLGQKGIQGASVEYRVSAFCRMNNSGLLTSDTTRVLMQASDDTRFLITFSEDWINKHLTRFNHAFDLAKPMNAHHLSAGERLLNSFPDFDAGIEV